VLTKGIETIFSKVIAENFLNLEKEVAIQLQKAFRTPHRKDKKRHSPRAIKTLGS
jgi:hypothetical protein